MLCSVATVVTLEAGPQLEADADAITPSQLGDIGTDLFDTELVIRAERAGLRVVDLPVEVSETRPSRTPIVKRAARSLIGLARMRWLLWRE